MIGGSVGLVACLSAHLWIIEQPRALLNRTIARAVDVRWAHVQKDSINDLYRTAVLNFLDLTGEADPSRRRDVTTVFSEPPVPSTLGEGFDLVGLEGMVGRSGRCDDRLLEARFEEKTLRSIRVSVGYATFLRGCGRQFGTRRTYDCRPSGQGWLCDVHARSPTNQ